MPICRKATGGKGWGRRSGLGERKMVCRPREVLVWLANVTIKWTLASSHEVLIWLTASCAAVISTRGLKISHEFYSYRHLHYLDFSFDPTRTSPAAALKTKVDFMFFCRTKTIPNHRVIRRKSIELLRALWMCRNVAHRAHGQDHLIQPRDVLGSVSAALATRLQGGA